MPADTPSDPRSPDEKARADLRRNDEMGLAVPESPAEEAPSVTPETFGAPVPEDLPPDRESRDDPLPQAP